MGIVNDCVVGLVLQRSQIHNERFTMYPEYEFVVILIIGIIDYWVRPAMVYGEETWAVKKAHDKKMEVAEMKMLRWMCGVTRLDKIRNENIRGSTKVGEI